MSYIGNPIVSTDFPKDTFSGNGSTTAFTMSIAPASVNAVIVAVSGVVQDPSTYTISGKTLTFSGAPPSGTSNISVRHLGVAGIPNTPSAASVVASSIADGAVTPAKMANGGAEFGMRNRIINGAMVIDQRNAGSVSNTTGWQYTVDRFAVYGAINGKFTTQQNAGGVTPPPGFTKYLGMTSTSAYSVTSGDQFLLRQVVEGNNIADLGWGTANAQTVTFSFWARSSLTGTFSAACKSTSGSSRSFPFSYSLPTANTWTKITVTIPGDTGGTWATDNTAGLQFWFNLAGGSTYLTTGGSWLAGDYQGVTGSVSLVGTNGATFYITGVQLEVGSSATGFEYRQYGQELALCQRYYQKQVAETGSATFITGVISSGSTSGNGGYLLMSPMRSLPTLDSSAASSFSYSDGASAFTCTSLSIAGSQSNTRMVAINFSTAGGLTQYRTYRIEANSSASAYLGFSAEL